MAIEQNEPIQGNTGLPGRTVANFLTDMQNLRNWWHEPVGAPGLVNTPEQGSPARLILQMALEIAGAQMLAELDSDQIAAAIPPHLADEVAEKLAAR